MKRLKNFNYTNKRLDKPPMNDKKNKFNKTKFKRHQDHDNRLRFPNYINRHSCINIDFVI